MYKYLPLTDAIAHAPGTRQRYGNGLRNASLSTGVLGRGDVVGWVMDEAEDEAEEEEEERENNDSRTTKSSSNREGTHEDGDGEIESRCKK